MTDAEVVPEVHFWVARDGTFLLACRTDGLICWQRSGDQVDSDWMSGSLQLPEEQAAALCERTHGFQLESKELTAVLVDVAYATIAGADAAQDRIVVCCNTLVDELDRLQSAELVPLGRLADDFADALAHVDPRCLPLPVCAALAYDAYRKTAIRRREEDERVKTIANQLEMVSEAVARQMSGLLEMSGITCTLPTLSRPLAQGGHIFVPLHLELPSAKLSLCFTLDHNCITAWSNCWLVTFADGGQKFYRDYVQAIAAVVAAADRKEEPNA